MQYRAGDAGRTAVLGDVVTVPGPWTRPPADGARQGSSVARLRTVDREAAEELFNACYPRLAGWVRRLVDDDDTAHEIASEAFTRLLARWSALDNPQSYLYMIATNLVRDHWRKTGRERRAIRTLTAAAPLDPAYHPVQDVDVRALIEALPAAAAQRVPAALLRGLRRPGGRRACSAGRRARSRPTCITRAPGSRPRWESPMTDPRDRIDTWLSTEVEPLAPPPGTFERIRRRARRRKANRALMSAAGVLVVIAAAVLAPRVAGAAAAGRRPGPGRSRPPARRHRRRSRGRPARAAEA